MDRRVPCFLFALAVTSLGAAGCFMHRSDDTMIDRSLITEDEIDSVHASSALDAIARLKPMFLVSRGKLTLDPAAGRALPNVYVDNQFYGDASVLRNISASVIDSIRFFSAADAQLRYGRGNAAGVIGIYTKH